ncbi:MAG: hypothetical protein IH956_08905 [Chloroflexi bacterium]|nr:hypothetical protein [Chloroflexota bacterium]
MYERSFSRAQLRLFDMLPVLHAKYQELQDAVNVTRRQWFTGFLTSSVPTVVLGFLVIALTVVTIAGETDPILSRMQDGVSNLALFLSMASLTVSVVVLLLWLVRKP